MLYANIRIKMIKNLLLFKKIGKINLLFVYLFTLLIILVSFYLIIPKFFNYSNTKNILANSLSLNSGLEISRISKINYKIFPTPRIIIKNVDINFMNKSLEIKNGSIQLTLNIKKLLNRKNIRYNKIFITNASPKIDITEMSDLLDIIEKNKKNIFFKKNNFIFIYKGNILFELKDTNLELYKLKNINKLSLNGYLLNKKISINYFKKLRHSLNISIPEINLSIKSLFLKENKITKGNSNIQIMNNFIRFNFIKDKDFKIENGFFRNKLIKTDVEGVFQLEPAVSIKSNLDFKNLDLEILNNYIIKKITNLNETNLQVLKKINGVFNINFNNNFSGEIKTENGTIYLKEFIISAPKYDLYLDGSFMNKDEFNIFKFQLVTRYRNKKKDFNLQFDGLINFTNKKLQFKNIKKNNEVLDKNQTQQYEKMFKQIVTKDNFDGIYNYKRINNFFNSIINNF